jgi:hypothetical protein
MSERFGDGSLMLYSFVNNELASIDWTSKPGPEMEEKLVSVRNSLTRVHGQPVSEFEARVDSQGSIAKIVSEVYRPNIEKDCVVRLVAISTGIEVNATDEAVYRRHGRSTARESYEEAVRAVSAVVQPNENPSELVDYLAAKKGKAAMPQPSVSQKVPTLQPPMPSAPVPTGTPLPSTPVSKVAESPALMVEHKSPAWPWIVGIAALTVLALLVLKRRA